MSAEPVRLVIWDLDETFWRGTITEGGITYLQAHHDIVVELARRGIISSICSKNDQADVEAVLREHGLWDHFILPSVDWSPKGPRIRDLIENLNLRAPTVMLIDDNVMNRRETEHFVPGIQTQAETFIPELLDHPFFKGKDDSGLTRLKQYQVLQRRLEDSRSAGDDMTAFLAASDIRVAFHPCTTETFPRVAELINRTNTLNYTKLRISEDPAEAAAAIQAMVDDPRLELGLVHVEDRYGDYGHVGFYAVDRSAQRLHHFCFSCRTLGLGVERWCWQRLGRPALTVVGHVLTDLEAEAAPVTWINAGEGAVQSVRPTRTFRSVFLRGGCELQAIVHYFETSIQKVTGEFFTIRDGLPIRNDHSVFMKHAFEGVPTDALESLEKLGYVEQDFQSALARSDAPFDLYLLGFNQDVLHALYRLRGTQIDVPFEYPGANPTLDIRGTTDPATAPTPRVREAFVHLRDHYDHVGRFTPEEMARSAAGVLARIPADRPVFMLLPAENWRDPNGSDWFYDHWHSYNGAMATLTPAFPNLHLLRSEQFMASQADSIDGVHFHRSVYYRAYERILALATDWYEQAD